MWSTEESSDVWGGQQRCRDGARDKDGEGEQEGLLQ